MTNYKKDAQIDPQALDVEWLNQPELERKYIEQVSELKREMQYAHEELKTIRSELILEANEDPEKCCGKPKPNAADIEAYYRTHERYKEAKQEMIEAEDAFEVAKDMKEMIHFTRTKALEELVTLHTQSYFAGPTEPRNLMKENEKRREETNKKTSKGMRRKK